jgi:hypothetical protein
MKLIAEVDWMSIKEGDLFITTCDITTCNKLLANLDTVALLLI